MKEFRQKIQHKIASKSTAYVIMRRCAPQQELLLQLLDSPGAQGKTGECLTNDVLSFYRALNDVKPNDFLL